VYGPREILGAGVWRGSEHSTWRNVIPTFIWKALHNLPLEVFGDATRDFIFVQDIASGVRLASEHGMNGEVYNLATGVEVSIKHLAETIKKLTKSKSEIVYRHPRVWDSSGRRFGSTVKSSNEIHFEATTDILDGLDKTIRWTVINKRRIALSIEKMSQNF
jgi:nucleoside-diphosphate-sugar epimerase